MENKKKKLTLKRLQKQIKKEMDMWISYIEGLDEYINVGSEKLKEEGKNAGATEDSIEEALNLYKQQGEMSKFESQIALRTLTWVNNLIEEGTVK